MEGFEPDKHQNFASQWSHSDLKFFLKSLALLLILGFIAVIVGAFW